MTLSRRDWLRKVAGLAVCTTGAAVGGTLLRRSAVTLGGPLHPALLRPPGADAEAEFLAACIRCGQCVEVCPTSVLKLAGPSAGLSSGTPYLIARETPCNLCEGEDDLRCIAVCPSKALHWQEGSEDQYLVEKLYDIDMGYAVLDTSICLAWNDQICRTCWHVCPFPDHAVILDEMLRAVIVEENCIGCGLCDYACPTTPSSFRMIPKGMKV